MYEHVHVFQARDGSVTKSVSFSGWANVCIFLSGQLLVAGGDQAQLKIWSQGLDEPPKSLVHPGAEHSDSILALAVSGDELLASGWNDECVHLWPQSQNEKHVQSRPLQGWVLSLAFGGNSILAACTAGSSGAVYLLHFTDVSLHVVASVTLGCSASWKLGLRYLDFCYSLACFCQCTLCHTAVTVGNPAVHTFISAAAARIICR